MESVDKKKQEVLSQTLLDYRNSLPTDIYNNNEITEQDLIQLENIKKQKIVVTQPFSNPKLLTLYKVGDILEVKTFPNTRDSEPPSFLVIDEKLGFPKYGFGGRGSTPFFELYEEKEKNESFVQKHKNHLLIALALVAGYFAYKKFKK